MAVVAWWTDRPAAAVAKVVANWREERDIFQLISIGRHRGTAHNATPHNGNKGDRGGIWKYPPSSFWLAAPLQICIAWGNQKFWIPLKIGVLGLGGPHQAINPNLSQGLLNRKGVAACFRKYDWVIRNSSFSTKQHITLVPHKSLMHHDSHKNYFLS